MDPNDLLRYLSGLQGSTGMNNAGANNLMGNTGNNDIMNDANGIAGILALGQQQQHQQNNNNNIDESGGAPILIASTTGPSSAAGSNMSASDSSPSEDQQQLSPLQQRQQQQLNGILDDETRLLLETILRLDDQMKHPIVLSESSGTSQVQRQNNQAQESSTTTTTTSSAPTAFFPDTSTTSSNSDEDDIQVPCRARGQPPEHNYRSAYFTIKQNEEHGKDLVCSFPQCRDSGIKFCYCAYCRVPVARRNFRIRHHHADAKPLARSKKSNKKNTSKDNKDHGLTIGSAALNVAAPTANLLSNNANIAKQPNAMISTLWLQLANLSPPIAQALQGQLGSLTDVANEPEDGVSNMPPPVKQGSKVALGNNNAMEEISRLGDSSSSTSSSDGSNVKIPCRARGMPSDHTIESAYFTIPKTIKHGDELICSYPACRDSGVKFCYCTYCRIPVAKRNFRIRHHHCDLFDNPDMNTKDVIVSGKPKDHKGKGKKEIPSTEDSDELTTRSPIVEDEDIPPSRVKDDGSRGSRRLKKKRKKVWSKLLDYFPSDSDEDRKTKWLAKCLLISDKKTPRESIRVDIDPEEQTEEAAALFLKSASPPRKKQRCNDD